MIERVARAIAGSRYDEIEPDERRAFRDMARSALTELRLSTGAMRTAGFSAARPHTSYFDNQVARLVFEAMIDSALDGK